ncbi:MULTISPECIES: SRPBCC family protein [unclassified Novosphingobium]|uniref:aromatic ring-hydroxylating oxygenase subunit alpha n=1 Tax=unclassified Novosphingobium TaxID=2644732 RepID=UPI000D307772|nr:MULTISPECIES: aromatic ring-hydroxylating dioxygenase subunit alpha [unclassified Novosphingobium]PTR05807.1 phenylpropionate dioxygenase-like ring-hydroxylating dioxygenase large terminal subunit [Novosphingobium sp. GV055]PUA94365.1 phenylpropionate dioxygenase-like ring-hydroxylating dioxygenase large terminal subunit [Novosphingobium sp. GV061]PUB12671.1 phenylpropionate dioxygenase-like ring-hydroxylating dioxygenase large terminal subunit [Novosphingobium sp. GV079]PUB38036.1 phenylpro
MEIVKTRPANTHFLTPGQKAQFDSVEDSDPSVVFKVIDRLPTDVYASQERFDLEIAKLFRGRPIPVAVSDVLPKPRTRFVIDDYGPSIVLTRDEEGAVHAFHNICTHRAIKLCQNHGTESGGLMTCPYHAWSFDMKGRLKSLPRPEIFPGLEKSKMGLIELECHEAGGLIWVNLDKDSKADFSIVTGPLAADFEAIALPEQKICKHLKVEVNANWKLIVDSFSENYHVTRLHAKSLGSMFTDRKTSCELIGEHLRVMSGRAGFHQGGEVETFEQFRGSAVVHYTLVPGALIITSPKYISVMLLSPQSVDRTVVNYYMLVDKLPETEEEVARIEKSLALMTRITTEEDFWVAELGTIAAKVGVVKEITCGGMEREIVQFHKNVNEILGL